MTDTSSWLDEMDMGPAAEPSPPGADAVVVTEGTPGAPTADTPAPGAVTPPPPPAPPLAPPPGFVPIATTLDERERRQNAERELAELRKTLQPAAAPPSITSDPEGWARNQEAAIERTRQETRLELSGRYAETAHGKETLEAAMAWGHEAAKTDPTFPTRFAANQDPFGFLVAEYRNAERLKTLGNANPDDWLATRARELGWTPPAGNEQQPAGTIVSVTPAPVAHVASPTPSLARAPGAGAPVAEAPIAEGDIVKALWAKK